MPVIAFHRNTVGLFISPSGRYMHETRTVKKSANKRALDLEHNVLLCRWNLITVRSPGSNKEKGQYYWKEINSFWWLAKSILRRNMWFCWRNFHFLLFTKWNLTIMYLIQETIKKRVIRTSEGMLISTLLL